MTNWPYVASLFDHRGNINLIKVKGKEYIQLRLYSSKEVLEAIKEFLGCVNIYVKELNKKNPNWKDAYELIITTRKDTYIILNRMMPFLVAKQDKAISLLKHTYFEVFQPIRQEKEKEERRYIG